MEPQGRALLSKDRSRKRDMFLKLNQIETFDNTLEIGYMSINETFYQVGFVLHHEIVPEANPDIFYEECYWLQGEAKKHVRQVYNILDLLGDLGGVLECFLILFGILLFPIAEFSFYLKIAKRLYFARTRDDNLFPKCESETEKELDGNKKVKKEILKHR